MHGLDTLLAKSYAKILKSSLDKATFRKFERSLFSNYGMSVKQSIEHFQNLDNSLRQFLGSEAKIVERKCMKKICIIKKKYNSNYFIINIKDPELNKLIFYQITNTEMNKVLHVTMDKFLSISEILHYSKLPKTSGYRKITSLVNQGLLVPSRVGRIDKKKRSTKYKTLFDIATIRLSNTGILIQIQVNKDHVAASSLLRVLM